MIGRIATQAGFQIPSARSRHAQPSQKTSAQTTSVAAAHTATRVQQSGVLNITTADGDTVTISFAGLQKSRSDAYQASVGGTQVAASRSSSSSSLGVKVQVDGSLDEQEMADIGSLMQYLGSAVEDSKAGDAGKLSLDLGATQSLSSLQGFQFAYQQSSHTQTSAHASALL